MLFPRTAAVVVALFTFVQVALAEQVTLKSTSSSVELIGELKSFDSEVYVLETDLGTLEVDARTVTCAGAACPKIESLASEFSILGNRALMNQLLVPLLESYSFSLDAKIETDVEPSAKSSMSITAQDGLEIAKIETFSEPPIDLKIDISTLQNALVISSGSAEMLSRSNGETDLIPIAADALVAITSEINSVRSITLDGLRNVLSGSITNWKDIGGPDADINIYLPSQNTDLAQIAKGMGFDISKIDPAERFDDFEELSKATSGDPYGLGITNFANLRTAKALPIRGSCGAYVRPSAFNISSGSYPATFYHYLQSKSETPPIFAREFLDYLNSPQARAMIDRQGYPSLSVFENGLENQGNRITHGLLATSKTVPVTDYRSMLSTFNGARQLSTVLRTKADSVTLAPQSKAALETLISELFLGNYADQVLMIVGFTGFSGDTDLNTQVSKIAADLIAQHIKDTDSSGLLADLQIETYGFGEASPLTCENSAQGIAINNRVEIWVKDNI